MVYTIPLLFTQNFFLTCFNFKISHLGWNDYPRLVLDRKWNFCLDLKQNIVLAFWETESTYFCFKMLYSTHFCPKRTVWTQKGLCLDQNTVLKCFDTEITYYGSKDSFDFVYTIPLLFTQNFFLTCFDMKISHLGLNDYPRLVLDQNEILVWIWSITLSLHFGKPKLPIFISKCYAALIFAQKGPYGHKKDCIWTKTQCLYVLRQKYLITVPKDSVDFV